MARHNILMRASISLVEEGVAGFDRQLSAALHRVSRIDCEIDQRVLDIGRVGQRVPESATHDGFDLDLFTEAAPQDVIEVSDQTAQIDDARFEWLTTAEGKQLRSEARTAFDAAERIVDAARRLRGIGDMLCGEVKIAGNHLQQIVEIMRDAAGKTAD